MDLAKKENHEKIVEYMDKCLTEQISEVQTQDSSASTFIDAPTKLLGEDTLDTWIIYNW